MCVAQNVNVVNCYHQYIRKSEKKLKNVLDEYKINIKMNLSKILHLKPAKNSARN